jgi:hypothetical protein
LNKRYPTGHKTVNDKGLPLCDAIIWVKDGFYAEAVGSHESCTILVGDGWLEKFKQKNKLLGVSPLKKSISGSRSEFKSQSQRISPISVTPPLSPARNPSDHPSAGGNGERPRQYDHAMKDQIKGSLAGEAQRDPFSPTQVEARQALELVIDFFEAQSTDLTDPQEFVMMGKLVERLKVESQKGELPKVMHYLVDGSNTGVSRKRMSIHNEHPQGPPELLIS